LYVIKFTNVFLELIALGSWMDRLEHRAQWAWETKLGKKLCGFTDHRNTANRWVLQTAYVLRDFSLQQICATRLSQNLIYGSWKWKA